jgi:glycosyltransferase involved in cell wall biosynthesis
MRIILVHNPYQQPGGEDKVVKHEAALLTDREHHVINYRRTNHEIDSFSWWEKRSLPKRLIWATDTFQALRALIKKENPEVAHFHNTFMMVSPAAYYACQSLHVPVVQTLHNYRLLCPNGLLYRDGGVCEKCLGKTVPWPGVAHACYRHSLMQTAGVAAMLITHRWLATWQNQVDIYVALTEFARKKFIEGGLPAEKIVVKPNFVHPDPGCSVGEKRYALFVGRLSHEKGLKTLLHAWQAVKGIPLKIAGDGPMLEEVRTFVQANKLERVEVLGRCTGEKVLAMMKGARFLVFPSEWYEGFPMTIGEAFACGIPVIASRLGATEEIVEDGRAGLHFTPGDANDLAAKVEWAWMHPNAMVQMGKEARCEYEKKYTAKQNYCRLMTIYKSAIAGTPRRHIRRTNEKSAFQARSRQTTGTV